MSPSLLLPGDMISVFIPATGRSWDGRLVRVLDRRGRRVASADLRCLAPFTTLVVEIDGQERCVPLWPVDGDAPALVLDEEPELRRAG
jgi:hypothetical protein